MTTQTQAKPQAAVTVWGTASGHGSTAEAARGAFTWRDYPDEASIQREDWLHIVRIQRSE